MQNEPSQTSTADSSSYNYNRFDVLWRMCTIANLYLNPYIVAVVVDVQVCFEAKYIQCHYRAKGLWPCVSPGYGVYNIIVPFAILWSVIEVAILGLEPQLHCRFNGTHRQHTRPTAEFTWSLPRMTKSNNLPCNNDWSIDFWFYKWYIWNEVNFFQILKRKSNP